MTQIYYKSPVGLINIKHTEKGIYSLTFEAKEIKNINYSSNLPLILKTSWVGCLICQIVVQTSCLNLKDRVFFERFLKQLLSIRF